MKYQAKLKQFDENPANFWNEIANNFKWQQKWDSVFTADFSKANFKWFLNAKLNITENILDENIKKHPNKIALIWEPNNPEDQNRKITYQELYEGTCKFANLYKKYGAQKGDRICLYMPMVPEAIFAMLACARIGAIHSVVFAGFSAKALADRIADSQAKFVVTSDFLYRGPKELSLLDIVREASQNQDSLDNILVLQRDSATTAKDKEVLINDDLNNLAPHCGFEVMDSEDPLFILYTSGSTGKPKGVMHTCGGYMVYSAYSYANVFAHNEDDIFFCSADIGWITGHSYMTYGPLLNGTTQIMFEGVPTHPTPSRFWEIIEKYDVTTFYTAPTAIRALMKAGNEHVEKFAMPSLRILGSVGEPINEEAWNWYNEKVGKNRCEIVDTWWQTETGGILISNLPGLTKSKPSYATKPLPGIKPVLLDNEGNKITEPNKQGALCFDMPWPSMIRSTWGDHNRCIDVYFSQFKGFYCCGDGAFFDEEGNFRIVGRIDDVINVSGHRLGTAEIENAINMHPNVTESAVIGFPHDIKGEGIFAFVIANENKDNTSLEIENCVKQEIGSIAKPDRIVIVPDLPKTRSGKIMRRILRKIASNEFDSLGDTSTLLNPDIVDTIKDKCSA